MAGDMLGSSATQSPAPAPAPAALTQASAPAEAVEEEEVTTSGAAKIDAAVAAAAAAYAIGVYTHVGDVRASLDLAAEAPGLHGTVAGLAVAGGIAGAVRGPGQMLSVLGKGWDPA